MRLKLLLQVTGSAGVAGFVVCRVRWNDLLATMETIHLTDLVPAVICVGLMLTVRNLKWYRLLRQGAVPASPLAAARSLLGGFALSLLTPGRVGEFGRYLFIPDTKASRVLFLNILDRALDAWALGTFLVASLFFVAPRPAAIFAVGVWLALLPSSMALPYVLAAMAGMRFWPARFRQRFDLHTEELAAIRVPALAAWSCTSALLDLCAFNFVLCAFRPIGITAALVTFVGMTVLSGLPVSISGLGVREAVAAFVLAHFSIPSAVAMEAAFFFYFLTAVLPATVGGCFWLASRERTNLKFFRNFRAVKEAA
jgi:glycosyltransferase 2 family protein